MPSATLFPKGEAVVQPPPGPYSQYVYVRIDARTLTTLSIGGSIDVINTRFAIWDAAHSLASSASRQATLGPGTLGPTPMGEVPTDTVTLGVGRLANTLSRVAGRPRSVAIVALEVARTLNTAEGNSVGWVMTLLLVSLGLDLGEGNQQLYRCVR